MTYRTMPVLIACALALITMLANSTNAAHDDLSPVPSMAVTDIGQPEGAVDVTPISINDNGTILVVALIDGEASTHVHQDGEYRRVGGEDASAFGEAINESGAIAGWMEDDGVTRAVLIGDENLVQMPGDAQTSKALGINSEGVLVGEATIDDAGAAGSPVYWTATSIEHLPSVGDGSAGAVHDLNTIEQMVGWSIVDEEGLVRHATVWIEGQATDLGTLGGSLSEAYAINETGQIVGASTTSDDQESFDSAGSSAFLWQDSEMANLGLTDDYSWGVANDINDIGLIAGTVGLAIPAEGGVTTSAVIWTVDAVLDLNAISTGGEGLTIVEAVSVNNLGQILCRAVDSESNDHIVVLTVLGN